jgi:hypothetical protein
MGKRIRIIKKEKEKEKPRYSKIIEAKAKEVAKTAAIDWDSSPAQTSEQEIALTLNHIDGIKQSHYKTDDDLARLKTYINTKLMQIWPGREGHVPYLFREQDRQKIEEKEKLQDDLLKLERERRKLSITLEEKLQPLHDRLLQLLQKRILLGDDDRNR